MGGGGGREDGENREMGGGRGGFLFPLFFSRFLIFPLLSSLVISLQRNTQDRRRRRTERYNKLSFFGALVLWKQAFPS